MLEGKFDTGRQGRAEKKSENRNTLCADSGYQCVAYTEGLLLNGLLFGFV